MRLSVYLGAAMASPFAVCRLHMRVRAGLVKSLHKVDTSLRRNIVTNVVASSAETPQKDETDEKDGRKSFSAVQVERQGQAERSVLMNCPPKINEKKFLTYFSRHGDIKKYFFYERNGLYAVVEFANRESVESLLEAATIPSVSNEFPLPFKSRLLSLCHYGSEASPNQQSGQQCQPQTTIPINQLIDRLSRKESIDQQVTSLMETYQLTDDNIRLRFLVCSLLRDIAAAYFPECTIKLFGSSVNGFGKLGCDLDMFLDLDNISGRRTEKQKSGMFLEYRLKSVSTERAVTQRILSFLGECVDQFGPGCDGVQKILNAQCPLVRFFHQPSGFQCDLTANNRVAIKSTELLYLYGELDPRVRHLVFTVRCWARVHCITSSISGAWITNFSLTVMVLFFLQRRNPPIIPCLDHLKDLAGPTDKSVIEGNDCTFVSDLSKIQLQRNTETLDQLLHEFFEFYSTFAFSKMSINIRKGKEQNKPAKTHLHIQNPFDSSLNISKNVNAAQLERFVALCQESTWLLQQTKTNTSRSGKGGSASTPWGLATLLQPTKVAEIKSHKKRRAGLASERLKGLIESLKNGSQLKKS
ncbi:poly(A) RNA polymerase, mitochondrial [Morone saxatilis]|uniref:poly(A) RNA polymerase, mitochondrial n=1 Tax=Morone saxatilis TaxID=34816 RepID=UPI0015E1F5D4|nr:poly(A) RNA polymerase, mitochondrial [Morone saxatilis]